MTDKALKAVREARERFKIGQIWENPDGLTMEITDIRNGKVIYKTPDDIGFQSIERLQAWLDTGAISEVRQDERQSPESC